MFPMETLYHSGIAVMNFPVDFFIDGGMNNMIAFIYLFIYMKCLFQYSCIYIYNCMKLFNIIKTHLKKNG